MIFQVSLAILDHLKEDLVATKDDGEAMTLLSGYLEHVTNRDSTMPRMPGKPGNGNVEKVSNHGNSWTFGISISRESGDDNLCFQFSSCI